jgi:hypothetical protein
MYGLFILAAVFAVYIPPHRARIGISDVSNRKSAVSSQIPQCKTDVLVRRK